MSNTIDLVVRSKDSFSSMMSMISHDYYTYTHSVNVSVLGLLFTKYLGIDGDEMQVFGTGLLLHDVGKTQIDFEIINKKERLNEEEFARIKMHVEIGAEILRQTGCAVTQVFSPSCSIMKNITGKAIQMD